MKQFKAGFTRYCNTLGRVNSAPVSISADNFMAAAELARMMLNGMTSVDRSKKYDIKYIEREYLGGETSEYAFDIFRIDEEEDEDASA